MDSKEMKDFLRSVSKPSHHPNVKARIQKELTEIKKLFLKEDNTSSTVLLPIAKLAFLTIVGVNIDFEAKEIMRLLNSHRLSNVRIGYLAASLIFSQTTSSFKLIIPVAKQHLMNFTNDTLQSYALSFISSLADPELVNEVINLVANIVICQTASEFTRKKAMLYLSYVMRGVAYNDIIDMITPALENYMIMKSNMRLAASTLVLSIMTMYPGTFTQFFDFSLKELLKMFVYGTDISDLMYYGTPAPWYSKQLLRMLKLKTSWSENEKSCLEQVSLAIFSRTGETLKIREAYSYLMVLNELMSLIAMVPLTYDSMVLCAQTIARHLKTKRVNVLSFAIDTLLHIVKTTHQLASSIQNSLSNLFAAMRCTDINVSKLAVYLMEQMSNEQNYKEMTEEFMSYIQAAPLDVRKVLCCTVPKILSIETADPEFFVLTNINLMKIAGKFTDDSIWQTTADKCEEIEPLIEKIIDDLIDFIKKTPEPSVSLMKLTIFLCGRYVNTKPIPIIELFVSRFGYQDSLVQSMIITMITRITTRCVDIYDATIKFLSKNLRHPNPEVSQRASECFITLQTTPSSKSIFESMPKDFSEKDLNDMLNLLKVNVPSNFEIDQVMHHEEEDRSIQEELLIKRFFFTNEGVLYLDNFIHVSGKLKYGTDKMSNVAQIQLTLSNMSLFPFEQVKFEISKNPEYKSIVKMDTNRIDVNGHILVKVGVQAQVIPLSSFPEAILTASLSGNNIIVCFKLPVFPPFNLNEAEEEFEEEYLNEEENY
ncbi:Adaptin N terminal region family protein [Trichomonas vaginalis G3]|uniref:Adaptin N terminal region family protein n=1 Tax=Trichomonas vaginalis (strain ATCC PRA-98 / G3) TaxID=412133 RepID=A2F8M2_TRIV3|nr:clathrin adaptor protein [Trichomonas vaginalis G3]EAX98754.1 Adaptin N terminal region family protein [Trichomonas vaginalis G3]KAI5543496.1 clathrin adaptor protein [Trichomonas vaginalis G3]|eukprot:XP_001311684.1 Adaptin N terminal region family protein [Trichomonas vaginalis G3]